MKTKSKVNVKSNATNKAGAKNQAKSKEAEKPKVLVTAAAKALVAPCIETETKYREILTTLEGRWETCGKGFAKLYKTREEAAPVLKETFRAFGKEPSEQPFASYVSKILNWGFPFSVEMQRLAKADGIKGNKLDRVNAGTLQKKGKKWVEVEKPKKGGGGAKASGGHNRKKPADTYRAAQAITMTAASLAKLDVNVIAVGFYEATKDTIYRKKGSARELLAALNEAFGE